MRPTFAVAAAVWALLWMSGVGPAWAHANPERSAPTSNAVLETSPRQIQIWFSEEPEPRFSEIVVYDAHGRRVDGANLRVAPGEPRALLVDLPEQPHGPYTVSWKALSAVDGHVTRGAYTFAIGLGQDPGAPVLPETARGELGLQEQGPIAVLFRWLTYLATAVLAGGVAFGWWVARPALGSTPVLEHVLRRTLLASAAVALVAGVAGLLVQAAAVAGVGMTQTFGAPLATLLATRYGLFWGARMLLVLGLAAALSLQAPGARERWLAPLQLALAGAMLLTVALNSHAAAVATEPAMAVALDWVHLVATAIWVGGLFLLAVSVPIVLRQVAGDRRRSLGRLVACFSPLAMWSVVGLLLSGLYQALLQVGSLEALTGTPYGQSLLWKLGLVLPMLGLGLLNAVWMQPRLSAERPSETADSGAQLVRWFGRTVGGEALLGALVLGVVGVLTTQEPARDALLRAAESFGAVQRAGDLRVHLDVAPATAGLNTLEVRLQDERGRPAEAQRVTLRFQHSEHDMGENEVVAEPRGDGQWSTRGSFLSMVGRWHVGVLVRRADRDDTHLEFDVPTGDPNVPRTQTQVGVAPPGSRVIVGATLLVAAATLLGRVRALGRRAVYPATAAASAVVGVQLLWASVTQQVTQASAPPATERHEGHQGGEEPHEGTSAAALTNPIPPTGPSVARGQELYTANCLACHGPTGRGDGPLARTLQPRPANLQQHVRDHTQGEIYTWISDGVPDTAMPAFASQLSEADRWHVVNFLVQTFAPNGPVAAPSSAPASEPTGVPASPTLGASGSTEAVPSATGGEPATETPPPAPTESAMPSAMPSPTSQVERVQVRTDGAGVSLRADPSGTAERLEVIPDGTILDVIGPDRQAEGRVWRNVHEPGAGDGWVAAEYLVPEPS